MLTIEIIEKDIKYANNQIFYKDRSRFPTVTDINIISDELLVVIHRLAYKIYLVKINKNKSENEPPYKIIDSLKIKYQTEMLSRNDNRLYIITFTNYLIIVDIIDNMKLKFVKEIQLSVNNNCYHGLEIYKNNLYIVPAVVKNELLHIIKLSLDNNEYKINKIISPEFIENTGKYRIKDISFLNDNIILLIITINNGYTGMKDYNHCDNGFIGLYNSDFTLLDKYKLDESHIDSLIIDKRNGNFYLTIEETEGGFIYKGFINSNTNKIENIKKIKVPNFPHGIDINPDYNLIGFTSYATSSAYLLEIDDLHF